jgi:hypothetical protein
VEKEGSSSLGSGVERSGVRHRRLLQIGGRAGRADGEMGEGRLGRASLQREKGGKRGRGVNSRTMGPEWLRAAWSEVAARAHYGGGLANRGWRRGTGDAANRWGRVATGPDVSGRVWEGEG